MYTLFDINKADARRNINIPSFKHVKTVIGDQTSKVQDYHRFYNNHIPSNHLLMRLLYSLNVSLERDLYSYVDAARERTDKLAKSFKLVHPTNTTVETYNGTFYNNNTAEYIIASDESFNISLAWDKWESIVPVKIHSHPFTDMSIGIPNGKYPPQLTKGAAVISINIAMLALQYKAWVHHKQNRKDVSLSLQSFVYNFVITNMIKRHTEIALINRATAFCTEQPISEFTRQHPLYIVDYTEKVDGVMILFDRYLEKRKVDFTQLFVVYPTLYFDTWAQVLRLPKIAPTRNSRWIFLLSYLPYIEFYLRVIKKQDSRLDREVMMQLKRHIKYMDNTSSIPTNLDMYTNIKLQEVKNLLESLGA